MQRLVTGVQVLLHLADWADELEKEGLIELSTYRGKSGIVSLLPRLTSEDAGLVTIYNDVKSAYLQFWRGVFERRAPRSIPAVEAALGAKLKSPSARARSVVQVDDGDLGGLGDLGRQRSLLDQEHIRGEPAH